MGKTGMCRAPRRRKDKVPSRSAKRRHDGFMGSVDERLQLQSGRGVKI